MSLSPIAALGDTDLEKGVMSPSTSLSQNPNSELSPSPSPSAMTTPALVLSNSGKRIDQGRKKYVKQVTGRHNDTELHLAAQRGDLAAVKQIFDDIVNQMVGTFSGADLEAEVAEIRASIVTEVNELGETAMFTAANKGHLDVVKELLKYSNKEALTKKNKSNLDPLHVAATEGHHAIVQVLLDHDPELSKTIGPQQATPLISAASRGHTAVVNELLSKDCNLLEIARSNGKNALHLAARPGHVDIVKSLLDKDPQLARRTDKKGQTALHMAVNGHSCEVVKLLLEADAAIVMLPDKFGNTALHVATRKKRAEKDVHTQLEQTKRTNKNVHGIAKELRKLHRAGINNATNSVTVVAVLFATVAFAAIFTVPGGDNDQGVAVVVSSASFKIFFIFNAIALFTSLAVVVVQITLVRGETKAERRVVEVINKLMWLASVCTSHYKK